MTAAVLDRPAVGAYTCPHRWCIGMDCLALADDHLHLGRPSTVLDINRDYIIRIQPIRVDYDYGDTTGTRIEISVEFENGTECAVSYAPAEARTLGAALIAAGNRTSVETVAVIPMDAGDPQCGVTVQLLNKYVDLGFGLTLRLVEVSVHEGGSAKPVTFKLDDADACWLGRYAQLAADEVEALP